MLQRIALYKVTLLAATILGSSSVIHAEETKQPKKEDAKKKMEAKYQEEAPLPEGWPKPGPFYEVTAKEYPEYRAAVTEGSFQNFAFLRLFQHIKRNDIPMTSPVEMKMEEKGEKLKMSNMSFLYKNTDVGKEGKDGRTVDVKNIPKLKTLSYAFQGKQNAANVKAGKDALVKELEKRNLTAASYRILGYNGPGVAEDKKTWELQAILK